MLITKLTTFLIPALFVLSDCVRPGKDNVRAVRVEGRIPAITPDTSYTINNAYDIFYYKDMNMYRFEYRFDSFFNGRSVLQELRPNFLVFQRDSLFGYSYYPQPDRVAAEGRIAVDTVFKRNAYSPFAFDSLFSHRPDTSYVDTESNLVKVYDFPNADTTAEPFTYYLYFSKKFKGLKDCFFSRSMADDGERKLFKIRIVGRGHYYREYNFALPPRELLYEMREIPVGDTVEVMRYFNRYRSDISR